MATPRTGLSTDAIIAISVTTPIVFLAVLLGLFLVYRKRRLTATADGTTTNARYEKPELDGEGVGSATGESPVPEVQEVTNAPYEKPELDGAGVANPVSQFQELVVELPAAMSWPYEIPHDLYEVI
jgi:hypothetical protein